jgi:hypothetical protein
MVELLQKLAVEGWWAWAMMLFVVTIAYLARHRVGLAALVRRWEPWSEGEDISKFLAQGEKVHYVDGPVLVTDRHVLVRKRAHGFAFAQGSLNELSHVEYSETWLLPSVVFGFLYVILGGLAFAFSGDITAMAVLGALIALAGVVILLVPVLMRPAALILTFGGGKPIIISGKWEKERLEKLVRGLSGD